jgi:hypothetical protein
MPWHPGALMRWSPCGEGLRPGLKLSRAGDGDEMWDCSEVVVRGERGGLLQLAYPLLKAAEKSSIVMISSVAGGPTAMRSGTIYAMTKGTFRS